MNGFTKFAAADFSPQKQKTTDKISDIQANYFTDIKNQIFSQLEGEIEKETEKEIERWKKERRSLIAIRDKRMEKEKKSNYLKLEN